MSEQQPQSTSVEQTAAEVSQEPKKGLFGKSKKKEKERKSIGREIFEWVMTFVAALAIALVIRTFLFEPVRVDGHSMDDSLADGEIMYVSKLGYATSWLCNPFADEQTKEACPKFTIGGNPSQFDVIILHYPGRGDTNFVKRVVAMPGDTVAVSGGYLYVNGQRYEEPYISDAYRVGLGSNMSEYTVPKKGDTLTYKGGYLYVNDDVWTWGSGRISGRSSDGDTLTFSSQHWYLNGKEVTYNDGQWYYGGSAVDANPLAAVEGKAFLLDQDYFFVMGDHRNNSNDSRSLGPVSRDMVVGHVTRVLLPFSTARAIPGGQTYTAAAGE